MPHAGSADGLAWLRAHHVHDGLDERARRKVLACARFDVLRVLFQQALIDFALDVNVQPRPRFAVNHLDEAAQLGRVLDAVLRLAKDDGDQARALAQLGQDVAVMGFERVAVALEQALPAQVLRDGAGLAQLAHLLVGHLEKEQVRELLDVIAVRDAVVAQDVAVIPQALNDG